MKLSDFDYHLPESQIAKYPLSGRTQSRMMVVDRRDHSIAHRHFVDICELLSSDDVLVYNNTRVIPARLLGKRPTGGQCEIFLVQKSVLHTNNENEWLCLAQASKKINGGDVIHLPENGVATVVSVNNDGTRNIAFAVPGDFESYIQRHGEMPLPPYLNRDYDPAVDPIRYQTVFARDGSAVASPTAGLHFDERILLELRHRGVTLVPVTLNVGLGTFLPVKTENVEDHVMHAEHFEISEESARIINESKKASRRIVAVGTTSLRSLESACDENGVVKAGAQSTQLFVRGDYTFKVVDAMLTNFHQPKSTLLMLVASFMGYDFMRQSYEAALKENYRFLSYGDCMFII